MFIFYFIFIIYYYL